LGITAAAAGNVTVSINKTGIESASKTVAVHKAAETPPPQNITYTATANGTANTTSSTAIAFAFSAAVSDLSANDITIAGSSVTKGALTGSGQTWSLGITAAAAGNVTVSINKTGIESASKTVTVHKAAETPPPPPPALTGTVSVTGTAQVGQTLTAATTSLGGSGAISYVWQRSDSATGTFAVITGAVSSTYALAAADLGKYIRVTASRADNSGTVSSSPTTAVVLPPLTGTVSVTGTAQVGQTLTAATTSLGGSGAISYGWQRSDSAAGTFAAITGAVSSTYTLAAADLGKYIRATASRADNSGTISSSPTTAVVLPPLTGTVSVTGTAQVGQTLTAATASLGGSGTISCVWQRADSAAGSFAAITGAASPTYTLAAADLGKYIRATASRADNSGTVSSSPTTAVVLPPLTGTVTVGGNPWTGQTLSAVTTSLGGGGAISYVWQRSDSAAGTFAAITGAASSTYALAAADLGKYIQVTASRADNNGTVSSAASGPVILPPLTGTMAVTGTVRVGQTLRASAGSLGGSGTISYVWQRADSAAGTFADITGAASSTYTLVAADGGKYIQVTVSRTGYSGTVSAAVGPVAVPGTRTITIGFNYGAIAIAGAEEDILIYKNSAQPSSVALSATGYDDVKWYVDGEDTPAKIGNSITINAIDYGSKSHTITFTGKKGGKLYSQALSFTVRN
jgi:hypothetical protein